MPRKCIKNDLIFRTYAELFRAYSLPSIIYTDEILIYIFMLSVLYILLPVLKQTDTCLNTKHLIFAER